jgi:excinuclease UvrABC nuclease subunit
MNSGDLAKRGFGAWRKFALSTEADLLASLPAERGVYSVRFLAPAARVRGVSDLAYVGKATNRNGLRGRIRQYFHPGWLQSTNLDMKARLVESMALELAYVTTPGVAEAADLESELLIVFESEHGERPPFNKQAALAHILATPKEP